MGVAIINFTAPTSTGNFDITDAGQLAGETPYAVILLGSFHRPASGSAEDVHAGTCIGWSDGTNQGVCWVNDEDARTTSDGKQRTLSNVACWTVQDPTGAGNSTLSRATASFITNGVRLNFTTASRAVAGVAILFFGTGGQARAGLEDDIGTGSTITSPGFQPHVVFWIGNGLTSFVDSVSAEFAMTWGIAAGDDSSPDQKAWAFNNDNTNPAEYYPTIRSNDLGLAMTPGAGSVETTIDMTSFNTDGFTVAASPTDNTDYIWFALRMPTGESATVVDFDTPTSTGVDAAVSGLAIEPFAAIAILTALEARDQSAAIPRANLLWQISAFNASAERAMAWRSVDNVSPSDAGSRHADVALDLPDSSAHGDVTATLSAFTADGVELDYSAVAGAAKMGFMLVFGLTDVVDPFDHHATQAAMEILSSDTPVHHATQAFAETLYQETPTVHTTMAFMEVLRSTTHLERRHRIQNVRHSIDPDEDGELEEIIPNPFD